MDEFYFLSCLYWFCGVVFWEFRFEDGEEGLLYWLVCGFVVDVVVMFEIWLGCYGGGWGGWIVCLKCLKWGGGEVGGCWGVWGGWMRVMSGGGCFEVLCGRFGCFVLIGVFFWLFFGGYFGVVRRKGRFSMVGGYCWWCGIWWVVFVGVEIGEVVLCLFIWWIGKFGVLGFFYLFFCWFYVDDVVGGLGVEVEC